MSTSFSSEEKPTRKSPRLPGYDYSSPGHYFITSCTYHRFPYLKHPILRSIVEKAWQALPNSFPHVVLDEIVIMSNHIHFTIELTDGNTHTLGTILRLLKGNITKAWNQHLRSQGKPPLEDLWQSRYHDHIVRHEADLNGRCIYIHNNPLKHALKNAQRRIDATSPTRKT